VSNSFNEDKFSSLFDVSRETINKLSEYSKILLSYNKKTNIIGNSTESSVWQRHFADSAKLFPILYEIDRKSNNQKFVCDIGTGGGFPGLVLAIMNEERKLKFTFCLVDSNKKKIDFIKTVATSIGVDATFINERAEKIKQKKDIIISRAFAPLDKFFCITNGMAKEKTIYILPKGKTWNKEINELKKKWRYKLNIVTNNKLIDNTGGVTLVLKELKKKL
tara:strand:+ start:1639 stop:2298 length:660 start_codon:yes stop_codon:yes gene_type:complete